MIDLGSLNLSHLAIDSWVSYVIAVALPAFDALIPVLPSETAIIALGVATAGSTDPRIFLLVALAALGAFLGDNLTYFAGRRLGPFIDRRVFKGDKGARRRAWAESALESYGARLIIVCRFIPGGRTAVMLVCGLVGYNHRRFMAATAVAGVIWACYAFFIGRLGGQAFESKPWAGLLLALGVALAITGLIEAGRRLGVGRVVARLAARRRPADPDESAGQQVGVDGAGRGGQLGDLDHRHALVPEPGRAAAGDEQGRLDPGQHDAADPGGDDQLGARPGPR
jgi:membrane-associated protein